MFMSINAPQFILHKKESDSYYVGGVAVWSGIRTNATRFNSTEVNLAKDLMCYSDTITIEEA